jgi:transmembrane sensor|tara:strand:+ start:730 stop:1770 length:1041 start_codon:yes stop_codon:yes gene_type:complete
MSEKYMQLSDQVNQQAAEWFTLLQSEDISASDRKALQAWLSEHADHREAFKQIELLWQGLGDLVGTAEGDAVRRSVESQSMSDRLQSLFMAPLVMFKNIVSVPRYALSLVAVICVAAGSLMLPTANAPVTAYYSTDHGEIEVIVLADNTEITLGAKSAIRTHISDLERSVELLSGEAFFDVAKDRKKPFFVTVNDVVVEVVGTQFNVQKIRDAVNVSVLEGIVNVFEQGSNDGQATSLPDVILTAGQKVVKENDRAFESVTDVRSSDLGAWRLGRLIYRDISLADIVADTGRYFDGKIVLQSNDLADVKVTMTLRTDQVGQLPEMLAQTLPLKVHVISDDIILLRK